MKTLNVDDRVKVDVTGSKDRGWTDTRSFQRPAIGSTPPPVSGILEGTVVDLDLNNQSITVVVVIDGYRVLREVNYKSIKDVL